MKNRRKFIKTILLTSSSLVLPKTAYALPNSILSQSNPLPREWVNLDEKNIKKYAKFIDKQKFRNISTMDIISTHARKKGSTWNSVPPEELWKNIVPTLKLVDFLIQESRISLKNIVSLYRSPEYNSKCPGAKPHSQHLLNKAIDIQMHCTPYKVVEMAKYLRDDRKIFKGGIGKYTSFTHIDTRGYNSTW